ncbi:hypothetical protein DPMN_035230 [Dreissena polymorpha]|uniref:Uncharacterized protein n=1 Tax=Dreissena polymorpha TaxID=45954 RepID=A0A9D4M6X1_DREPO|nr:hypothetical protein DPMN_035230 [Dreissena polymorpha]
MLGTEKYRDSQTEPSTASLLCLAFGMRLLMVEASRMCSWLGNIHALVKKTFTATNITTQVNTFSMKY